MLVLDENIPAGQRHWLRKWRVRFRSIGVELSRAGADDEDIIPLLHRLPQPAFFTLDKHFFRLALCHAAYCLVWLDVPDDHAARFIRRFLKHPSFDTAAKRLGKVVHVHAQGARFFERDRRTAHRVNWT